MDKQMKVVLVEPEKEPRVVQIDGTLESMQDLVDGNIEPFYDSADGTVHVCNEEGKLIGLKGNRKIGGDIIAGNFFICGDKDGEFISLNEAQIETYKEKYEQVEHYEQEEVEDSIFMKFIAY